MKTLITIMIGILATNLLVAQSNDKTKLDSYFNALEANNKFMGSVAVSHNGTITYTKSIGYADVESKLKSDHNSEYRIGSISKTFTAALTLKAIEEQRLKLDQTLSQFYPTIKNASKITIQHLMNQRSGITSFTDDPEYLTWCTKPITEEEMIKLIAKASSRFDPGSKFEYSNSNFILLSFILQKVYKTPFAELLAEKITKPIGLQHTYLGKKIDIKDHECNSYSYTNEWKKQNETDISVPIGAGGIVSTPTDLILFIEALFNGKIISKESLNKMTTIVEGYGMGLIKIPYYENIGYGHTGAIDGFTSTLCYFPDTKISFALLSNGTNYNNNDIAINVLNWAYNKPFEIPEFKTVELSSSDLDKYIGVYSSEKLPLKVTVTKTGNVLTAQATGQSAFILNPVGNHKFTFDAAGIVMEFNPEKKSFLLKQGGGEFLFTKE